tara:strand:- start:171 stop:749 length:579 start_codon:yes stop_codon:yes gene_type:complete
MQSSKRNNPCPVCGRTKDSDCRWDDDVIFCHNGSNYFPPTHLTIGDILRLNGVDWALVKTNSGHTGRCHVFKPHRPINRNISNKPREDKTREAYLFRESVKAVENYIKLANAALEVINYEYCNLRQIKESKALINRAYDEGKELREVLVGVRRFNKNIEEFIELFDEKYRPIKYQKKASDEFCWNHLGEIDE